MTSKIIHLRLWIFSIILTFIAVMGVVTIWYRISNAPFALAYGVPILSQEDLNTFLLTHKSQSPDQPPIYIPTGIFLQSLEFNNANDVIVTGYIWQKVPSNLPKNIKPGFILPEGENVDITEAYRVTNGDVEVIGWYFVTTLREQFYYDQYPLDRQDIWIRFWPTDFDHNVILIPDLEAYTTLIPDQLPGLDKDFVLENWDVRISNFFFYYNEYNTNFGLKTSHDLNNHLELYFNVGIERNTLNALLTFVAPPLITALMVFGILLISTAHEKRMGITGWNTATSLGFCASLLFVIIFAQISMRDQLNAPGVIYLEYMYFIVYIAILLVSLNSILFQYTDKLWFLEFEDNLLPKVLYWPLLTFSFLVITYLTFR